MAKVFKKRSGTTDRGKDYEHLYIANLILKLTIDDKIDNFYLSSNDEAFGSFDDVVVEIKYHDQAEQIFALQLKHVARSKMLKSKQLLSSGGNFSLLRYIQEYEDYLKDRHNFDLKLILFTNLKAHVESDSLRIELVKTVPNPLLSTCKSGHCYTMWDAEGRSESFFRNFCLYTNQAGVTQLKKESIKLFSEIFDCDKFKDYFDFIVEWSMTEGRKDKLDKEWMQQLISMQVLTPFIKPLTFVTKSLPNDKTRVFKEAIFKFHVTTLSKSSYDEVKDLWSDLTKECHNLEEINRLRVKYQLYQHYIQNLEDLFSKLDETQITKVFWLLDKCPLIVDANKQVCKAITFSQKHSLILLTSKLDDTYDKRFGNLSNLKEYAEIYEYITNNFQYSLEGQKETNLNNLLRLNPNLGKLITVDDLVGMINDSFVIGSKREVLPACHVARKLTKTLVDIKFLKEVDTTVVINQVENFDVFQQKFKNRKVVNCDLLNYEILECPAIYVKRSDFSQSELAKHKSPHCFTYVNEESLEWIASSGGVEDLQNFRLNNCLIGEDTYRQSGQSLNVICAGPGMGKTTFMKSCKNNLATTWNVLIYARNHALFFRKRDITFEDFFTYILSYYCGDYGSIEKEIFRIFLERKQIQVLWDGVDEVGEETLSSILLLVQEISRKGLKQFITARPNLQSVLETRLKILSRSLMPFNEEEQRLYFKDQLEISDEKSHQIFKKVGMNIQTFANNDILGIPLQIYMFVELFRQDVEKYSSLLNNSFTILDLYEHFVGEKFQIYYRDKNRIDVNVEENNLKCKTEITYTLDCYEKLAFALYFDNKLKVLLNSLFKHSKTNEFLENIKRWGDSIGFITSVNSENVPEFIHNSYGEYFAALFLFHNNPNKAKDKNFIFNKKYNNIRFFLDLMLTRNLKAHVAVLYKNSELLEECNNEQLNNKDLIHRNTLEVSCAWSKKYVVEKTSKNYFHFYNKQLEQLLRYKQISKRFKKIDNTLSIHEKKLLLLLPFFIPLYDETFSCFDDKYAVMILNYAFEMDCVVIFDYIDKVAWLNKMYKIVNPVRFVQIALTHRSNKCLKRFVLHEQYHDVFRKNLNVVFRLCSDEFSEIYLLLVENLIDVNRLMFQACEYAGSEVVEFLLRNGASVNLCNDKGQIPLHYACKRINGLEIARVLVANGSKLDEQDEYGCTPLHYACKNVNRKLGFEMVKFLVEVGSRSDIVDKNGKLPIIYAHSRNNFKITQFL